MKTRLILFTGQMLDLATFCLFFAVIPSFIISQLGISERNPIISQAFAIGGFMAVAAIKLGIVSFVLYRDTVRTNRPKVTGAIMTVAAGSGFVGAFFNTTALITVLSIMGAI